jgi:two-component system sensor histidine kinase MprB
VTVVRRWWSRRTLHDRLALLVSGAVAAAVLLLAVASWVVVAEIQHHRMQSELTADAAAIAAAPDQWLAAPGSLPDVQNQRGDGYHGPHQLGPRWQILGASATVISPTTSLLPVTAKARQVATTRHRAAEEQVDIDGGSYLMLTVPVTSGGAVQVAIDQDPDNDTLTMFGVLLAAGCVLGIAGAAFLGRTVARAGLVPVQRLTEAVEDVAVTMDLTRPIAVSGVDEIARLSTSVNTMLTAIDTARRAQRALVGDAGHELRTPLTSLRTNIELLLQVERHPELAHRLSAQDRARLLTDLEAQVGELATLTTELVELAREETTREAVESVDLSEVVDAAINRVRIRAPGLAFTTDLAPAEVLGRPGELERMVVNVLDNAAKFSPPGATVDTRLTADGVLTVMDEGPGIDEADRPHVFDRFYRAVAARSTPGSGLGLAIVAQTAAQHDGTVTTGPREPHGTIVSIRLPVLTKRLEAPTRSLT